MSPLLKVTTIRSNNNLDKHLGTMVAVSTMFKTAQKIWDNMELVRNCTDESDEICNPLFMHIGASVSEKSKPSN